MGRGCTRECRPRIVNRGFHRTTSAFEPLARSLCDLPWQRPDTASRVLPEGYLKWTDSWGLDDWKAPAPAALLPALGAPRYPLGSFKEWDGAATAPDR